jgi:hypothetical protein
MRRLFSALLLSCCTVAPAVSGADLQPYQLDYTAHYRNLAATATRTLQADANGHDWLLQSSVALELMGATVVRINETSRFGWQHNQPVSREYAFVQTGLGSRERKLQFAEDGHEAAFAINDEMGVLALAAPTFDNLNLLLVLRDQLAAGNTDISFPVADRGELSMHRYQVVGEEQLTTAAGSFATVHLQRIREEGNTRTTDFWLARDHDYVLVKLLQTEPGGDNITLEVKQGTLAGQPLASPAPIAQTAVPGEAQGAGLSKP